MKQLLGLILLVSVSLSAVNHEIFIWIMLNEKQHQWRMTLRDRQIQRYALPGDYFEIDHEVTESRPDKITIRFQLLKRIWSTWDGLVKGLEPIINKEFELYHNKPQIFEGEAAIQPAIDDIIPVKYKVELLLD